ARGARRRDRSPRAGARAVAPAPARGVPAPQPRRPRRGGDGRRDALLRRQREDTLFPRRAAAAGATGRALVSTREHPETDRALEQRAKELLDASAAELDAATRARLAVARERALEAAAQTHRPALGSRGLVPAGAAAIAIVAAALWWLAREPQPDAVGQVVA